MMNLFGLLIAFLASINSFSMNSQDHIVDECEADERITHVETRGCINMYQKVDSFDAIFKKADRESNVTTIYLVDLDFTLTRPIYPLLHFSEAEQVQILEYAYENDPRLSSVGHEDMQKFADYLGLIQAGESREKISKHILVEENSKQLFVKENALGAIFIGLTARDFSTANVTHTSLNALGVDFSFLSKLGDYSQSFSEKAGFRGGIYYAGGALQKALGMVRILDIASRKLRVHDKVRLKMIDDNLDEINAVLTDPFIGEEIETKISITPYYKPFYFCNVLVEEYFMPWAKERGYVMKENFL